MIERCEPLTNIFDCIHHFWEHPRTQKILAVLILLTYLLALAGIEANREGLLPEWMARLTPTSHFQAIQLAFTLILGMELMELILSISGSLSKSLGKQFEVMALILLRDAFKQLSARTRQYYGPAAASAYRVIGRGRADHLHLPRLLSQAACPSELYQRSSGTDALCHEQKTHGAGSGAALRGHCPARCRHLLPLRRRQRLF